MSSILAQLRWSQYERLLEWNLSCYMLWLWSKNWSFKIDVLQICFSIINFKSDRIFPSRQKLEYWIKTRFLTAFKIRNYVLIGRNQHIWRVWTLTYGIAVCFPLSFHSFNRSDNWRTEYQFWNTIYFCLWCVLWCAYLWVCGMSLWRLVESWPCALQ